MQPEELKKKFDFEIGQNPRNLESIIEDCGLALYYQVRTGKLYCQQWLPLYPLECFRQLAITNRSIHWPNSIDQSLYQFWTVFAFDCNLESQAIEPLSELQI